MLILMNDLKTLLRILIYSISNALFFLFGLLIGRNDNIVLFGAWMGTRFADNSRFLFQFLAKNKDELSLKRVIWVSRKRDVVDELTRMGYETYLIGTWPSMYWHLKAGIHIMCNMSAKSGNHLPDIDVKLSSGAKKVQLWHGVGIKAVGATSNAIRNSSGRRSRWVSRFANKEIIRKIGSLGGWAEPKILCTSELNVDINVGNSNIHRRNAFISGYPRYCDCLAYTDEEKSILNTMRSYSNVILYLPTFRDEGASYYHPLESKDLQSFILRNNILWIEKPHQAERNNQPKNILENAIYLKSDFDVNILLQSVDAIVSDYSSAAFDAIYLRKPVIMYVPDLDEFEKGGNGLLFNLREYCPSLLSFDVSALIDSLLTIINQTYLTKERSKTLDKMRLDFFENKEHSYFSIWQDIKKVVVG